MFKRGDARFDLFTKNIFQIRLKSITGRCSERRDFIRKDNTLTLMILSIEDPILLKSVTARENDYADIELLLKKEKEVSWCNSRWNNKAGKMDNIGSGGKDEKSKKKNFISLKNILTGCINQPTKLPIYCVLHYLIWSPNSSFNKSFINRNLYILIIS